MVEHLVYIEEVTGSNPVLPTTMTDFKVAYYFNHLGLGTWLDFLTKGVSSYYFLLPFFILLIILVMIFDVKNIKWLLATILVTLVINFLITDLFLKHGFFPVRLRPYIDHPDQIISLGQTFRDSSFPSGHMTYIVSLLTLFIYLYRKFYLVALSFIIILAFSRVHNGMHYPTDVLSGAILGFGYGWLTIYLINRFLFGKIKKI